MNIILFKMGIRKVGVFNWGVYQRKREISNEINGRKYYDFIRTK